MEGYQGVFDKKRRSQDGFTHLIFRTERADIYKIPRHNYILPFNIFNKHRAIFLHKHLGL